MSSSARHPAGVLAVVAASVLLAAPSSHARAQGGDYNARSVVEPAATGLPVSPPLQDLVAVSGARVILRADWRVLSSAPTKMRFITPPDQCRYRLTVSVRTRVAAPSPATEYVAGALPAPGAPYLLDSGQRGTGAFRVVRRRTTDGVVRIDGLWAGVLTRRADIVAAGQVAWSEVRVTASSSGECHSGTWRERMGPQIGDALAAVRGRLRFVRAAQ